MKFDVYFVHEYYIHNSNVNNNSHITIIKRDTWKKRKRTNLSRQKYEQLCRFLSETKEKENEKEVNIYKRDTNLNDFFNDHQDHYNNREYYFEDFIVVY